MSKIIQLNRIRITGKLNENTPSCVVLEVLQAHNISVVSKIDSLVDMLNQIKTIEQYRTTTLTHPLSDRDYRYVATFVNASSTTWTKTSLMEAYDHMVNFDKNDINQIIYGQKNHNNIRAYNACMLYSLCHFYKISTKWNMSPTQMETSLKQLSFSVSTLKDQLSGYIQKMNKEQLINLMNNVSIESVNETAIGLNDVEDDIQTNKVPLLEINPIKLKSLHNKYKDTKYLLRKIIPKSHNDAIILGALVYNINLTHSKFPLDEYLQLKGCKKVDFYVPIDKEFQKKYLRNSLWFDLTVNWEPSLSFIYDDEGLRRLCLKEGYTSEDFRNYSPESLLQLSRISNNVFLGKNIFEDVEQTAISMIDLKDIESKNCVTIGNIETKTLYVYTFDELTQYFDMQKEYKNPVKEIEVFDKKIVNKLRILAESYDHQRFLYVMESIEKWKEFSDENTNRLRKIYSINKNVSNFLYQVMNIGMYMRGWKVVCDEYPLREAQTKVVDGTLSKIEVNFVTEVDKLYQLLNKYNREEKECLESLPLIRVSINGNVQSFIITPEKDDGKNILDRLQIVSEGDKHKNSKSCIRVTSNILLITSYYYLRSLGLPEPFNINELDHIT